MPSYTIKGKRYNVPGAICVAILNDHDDPKAYHPKFIVGCDRCGTFCIQAFCCPCCRKGKGSGLTDEPAHGPIIETSVFVAKLKAKAA